jgi:hypothetical protein
MAHVRKLVYIRPDQDRAIRLPAAALRRRGEGGQTMSRQMISCHKGLAPISFPAEWLDGFDAAHGFAAVEGEGRIRFPNGRAFGVSINTTGPEVLPIIRELSAVEIAATSWGGFCRPWERYDTAQMFGHSRITQIA